MSKRASTGQNTLFNYFSPKTTNSNNQNGHNRSNLEDADQTPKKIKEKRQPDNSSDDENVQPNKRRKRIIAQLESSDSEEDSNDTPRKQNGKSASSNDASTSLQMFEMKKKNDDTPAKRPASPEEQVSPVKQMKLNIKTESSSELQETLWLHDKLDFLKPEYIKDIKGRKPSHPDYNPRTLYVPNDYLNKLTPAMRQWWVLKSQHFDCVLFFKLGKFYELYHMDAVIGVNELGFSFMKGDFAHSGFPESAYGRFSSTLIELGYKVARVEQTETPEMMQQRTTGKGVAKWDKVVRRELCQISNRATQVNAVQDLEIKRTMPEYLLAVCESIEGKEYTYGVCFVDTSVGRFYIGTISDNEDRNGLLTLLSEHKPAAILVEKGKLHSETMSLLKNAAGNVPIEALSSSVEFYTVEKSIQTFETEQYFHDRETEKWNPPQVFLDITEKTEDSKRVPKPEYMLALRCLGAIHWYLKTCLLDVQLFSIRNMEIYRPNTHSLETESNVKKEHMILDASALSNLHILGPNGTLQSVLDNCCSQFGKRLLKLWICRPLCDIKSITSRQEAITELLENPEACRNFREILPTIPDLERQLTKIHSMGNYLRSKHHPDSRAIFYEEKLYSKKKIQNFMSTLQGFEKALDVIEIYSDFNSKLIQQNARMGPDGNFPDIRDTIRFFKNAFDHKEAEKEGKIIPQPGMDEDYDKTIQELEDIKRRADNYLKEQEKFFACKLSYFGTDKKRYQLDIPEHAAKKVTNGYYLEGQKKGSKASKRYHTDITKSILQDTLNAEKANREILQDLNRRIFEKFSAEYDKWIQVVNCLSMLDCLVSLAEYVKNNSVEMCIPTFVESNEKEILEIKGGVHPFIPNIENFVPNDAEFGTEKHPIILMLTGPNMGGKSTLMRQVAVLTIMAQMGCYVPASELKMTLVDRIFTRLGARDDIMSGHSTFNVELREAITILQYATKKSLVLLDELGRGTSTFDGTAIAASYINSLVHLKCRTIFSTHYYNVLEHFKHHPDIQLGHMACKVESDEADATQETVTFMYKMIPGACPKSYGFNAARLAGITSSITSRACQISNRIEMETDSRKVFGKLFCSKDNIRGVLESLQKIAL